jgi:LysM repeat protein
LARTLAAAALAAVVCLGLWSAAASAYDVQPGDTLWSISQRTGVPVDRLAHDNGIRDPNRIRVGQHLAVNSQHQQTSRRVPESVKGSAARTMLIAAARERGVNPSFVLAVSLWESGYNQTMISSTGAVGMMQIEPYTADWAGPSLLGRSMDIYVARDNARLGAALLRRYLDDFNDPKLALAAYYQGEAATKKHGVYPSSQNYVNGVWALRNQLQAQS